jgi:uncharacterized protein (TIGR02231 family)
MKLNSCWALAVTIAGMAVSAPTEASEPPDAKIVEVTVYADRARVTRSATFRVPAGPSVVEIRGLTTSLDDHTVEVSGQSSRQVTIRGLDVRQEFLAGNASPRTAEVQQQLDTLLDQKRALDAQAAILDARQSFFKSLSSGIGHSEKGIQDVDDVKRIYDFYLSGLTEVSSALLDLQGKLRSLELEIDRAKRELSGLSQQKATRKVSISVEAVEAADLTITLRYVVPDASWKPIYDARVNTANGSVLLAYNAYVRQKTGEEWDGVKLSVSTARPGVNGQLPELSPDYVNWAAPPPPPVAAENPEGRPKLAKADRNLAPAAMPTPEPEVSVETANLQTVGLAVTYVAPAPVSIPSDNQPHQTSLSLLKFSGELAYVCTPKLELGVFVKVHLANSSPDTLLAGGVNLFRDGDLIGTMNIPQIAAGAEFDLFCGRDDAIKVDRKELATRQSETGFFNHRKRKQRKFQISIQNYRKAPVKMTVYDQLPVSQDSQISVSQGQMSLKPADFDKDSGKLTWTFSLDPMEKKVIEFEYTIEWPADKEISD